MPPHEIPAKNKLYYGDNLAVLRDYIPAQSVDLIYLDPPFNSRQDNNVLFAEKDGARSASRITAFKDTGSGTKRPPVPTSPSKLFFAKNLSKSACQAPARPNIPVTNSTPITYPRKIAGMLVMLQRVQLKQLVKRKARPPAGPPHLTDHLSLTTYHCTLVYTKPQPI
jgi:hypothetical protein